MEKTSSGGLQVTRAILLYVLGPNPDKWLILPGWEAMVLVPRLQSRVCDVGCCGELGRSPGAAWRWVALCLSLNKGVRDVLSISSVCMRCF